MLVVLLFYRLALKAVRRVVAEGAKQGYVIEGKDGCERLDFNGVGTDRG